MICLGVNVLAFTFVGILWASWVCGLLQILLLLLLLSSHRRSDYLYATTLETVPRIFSFFFFILCILVWEVSIDSSSSSLILPFTVSRLLMSLLKAFFLSVTLFLIYNISFWFSLLLPIYSIILSTISTRALNTLLIIVILSPCAMILKSVSCAIWMWCSLCLCRPCFVSSLSMPCHFFCWKWSMMYEVIKLFLGS